MLPRPFSDLHAVSYSFEPHIEFLLSSDERLGATAGSLRSFALIDAAQLNRQRRLMRHLPRAPTMLLYENTTAHAALHLSPVVIALERQPAACMAQLRTLDSVCKDLPVMAILRTSTHIETLLAHLRSLLQIEVDGKPFLLRFADTQMLKAANLAFTPAQRAWFFGETEAWFSVDHTGQLIDAADHQSPRQEGPTVEELKLDDAQLAVLMEGAAAPVLAAQIRSSMPEFGERLSHARQITFAEDCVFEANEIALDLDKDLFALALRRWDLASPLTRDAALT